MVELISAEEAKKISEESIRNNEKYKNAINNIAKLIVDVSKRGYRICSYDCESVVIRKAVIEELSVKGYECKACDNDTELEVTW